MGKDKYQYELDLINQRIRATRSRLLGFARMLSAEGEPVDEISISDEGTWEPVDGLVGVFSRRLNGDATEDLVEWSTPAGFSMGDHRHESEEKITLLTGEMLVRIWGHEFTMRDGDEFIIPANEPHSGCTPVPTTFVTRYRPPLRPAK